MSLEEAILNALRSLPPQKQKELLDYARQLAASQPPKPRKNGRGLWADLNIDVSAEDIEEVRREMWKNFPRDDF